MRIKITADSTCDLGEELCKRYDISIAPLSVLLEGKYYHDGVDIDPFDIFESVSKTNVLPKTSAVSVGEYKDFFGDLLKENDYIIHYNISSKASSSYENAKLAAKDFIGRVFPVDSLALSTGQGLLVLKAKDLVDEGKSVEEIISITEGLRPFVNTSFVPDSLDYLHKGGRCSLLSMMGAKLLKLHPLIEMDDGQMYAKRKLMGTMDACFKRYIQELSQQYTNYDNTRCFITHSHCADALVKSVKSQIERLFSFKEILITTAGSVITSHCGKNTLGLLFISK